MANCSPHIILFVYGGNRSYIYKCTCKETSLCRFRPHFIYLLFASITKFYQLFLQFLLDVCQLL